MTNLDNVLELLTNSQAYTAKLQELKKATEEYNEAYARTQAERGKLQTEKEQLEDFKFEWVPKKQKLEAKEVELNKREQSFNELVQILQTYVKGY